MDIMEFMIWNLTNAKKQHMSIEFVYRVDWLHYQHPEIKGKLKSKKKPEITSGLYYKLIQSIQYVYEI